MICPVCGNPNAGRRHGFAFENEFYCGECKKSYTEVEWRRFRSKMVKEAIEMWAVKKTFITGKHYRKSGKKAESSKSKT